MNIGIDILGSSNRPEALFEAALDFCKNKSIILHVFGPKIADVPHVIWHESTHAVSMDACGTSSAAFLNTSMAQGITALKEGLIDAFISCGNTAALLTYSTLQLPKLPNVLRLALLAQLGTKKQNCFVMDVGASTQATAQHLYIFSLMGKAVYRALFGKNPKFGLLNMASEKGKGPSNLKTCFEKLSPDPDFLGNVEPDSIFKGDVPLVLTDGFTGNIFLKTAEAVAQMTLDKKIENSSYNPQAYPGALLCGADRLVFKVHGKGDTRALQKTLQEAIALIESDFLTRVKNEISALKEEPL